MVVISAYTRAPLDFYNIDTNGMRLCEQPAWIQFFLDVWDRVRRKIFLFCFNSSTNPRTFSSSWYGSTRPARYTLSVANLSSHSTMDFIASLRPVCEIIFYFLILSYLTGIYAQYQLLCSRGEQNGENLPLPGSHSLRLPLRLPASMSKRTKLRPTLPNVLKQSWFWLFSELGEMLSWLWRYRDSITAMPAVFHRPECEIM